MRSLCGGDVKGRIDYALRLVYDELSLTITLTITPNWRLNQSRTSYLGNEYLSIVKAHGSYWRSGDVAAFVLRRCLGIREPDQGPELKPEGLNNADDEAETGNEASESRSQSASRSRSRSRVGGRVRSRSRSTSRSRLGESDVGDPYFGDPISLDGRAPPQIPEDEPELPEPEPPTLQLEPDPEELGATRERLSGLGLVSGSGLVPGRRDLI